MNRRATVALLGALAAIALIASGWWWSGRQGEADAGGAEAGTQEQSLQGGEGVARLYFPGLGGRLHTEERELQMGADAEEAVRVLMAELLAGPRTPGGFRTFAADVELGSVYVAPEGIAYVDLRSADGGPPPASGSQQEILSVYSIVNSVVLNVSQIQAVALLWNGQQRLSFAGHLDTSRPLGPRTHLIRG